MKSVSKDCGAQREAVEETDGVYSAFKTSAFTLKQEDSNPWQDPKTKLFPIDWYESLSLLGARAFSTNTT